MHCLGLFLCYFVCGVNSYSIHDGMDGMVTVYFKELMVVGVMTHTKKKGKRILLHFVGRTVCNCAFVMRISGQI